MAEELTQLCDNCQKQFPQSKIATHFGYCRRNIKRCTTCGQMYDINFTQDHQQQFHKMSPCKHCKKKFKPNELIRHEDACPQKSKFCEYCQLNVPIKDYNGHLKECEARTSNCQKCRKPIANKDFLIHQISCPGYVEQIKPKVENKESYNSYQQYMRNNQKREQNKRQDNRPKYQEPIKQISSKGVLSRQKVEAKYQNVNYNPSYNVPSYNNPTYNNPGFSANYNKQIKTSEQRAPISRDKPSTGKQTNVYEKVENKNVITKDLSSNININNVKYEKRSQNTNKYGGLNLQRKVTPSNVPNRQEPIKNVGSNKNIDTKYSPSIRTTNTNPISNNLYTNPNTYANNNIKQPSYSNKQYDPISNKNNINFKPTQVPPSNNYPKVSQNYKKQVLKQKDAFMKKQQRYKTSKQQPKKGAQINYNQYINDFEDLQSNHQYYQPQPRRNVSPTNILPQQNNIPSSFGLQDQDQQIQKAIMASMGFNNSNPTSNKSSNNRGYQSKPQYNKMQDIPAQFLQKDMMNQSFYEKQRAIQQQIQRNKRRR